MEKHLPGRVARRCEGQISDAYVIEGPQDGQAPSQGVSPLDSYQRTQLVLFVGLLNF